MTDENTREPGQRELVPLQHAPMQPARRGHAGEQAFSQVWRRFAQLRPEDFAGIFSPLTFELDQRAASAAASFFTWLGTNCGSSFYNEAMREWRDRGYGGRERAFIARWAHENRRVAGVNHGLRVIEFLLAPRPPVRSGVGGDVIDWELVPQITLRDLDVVECVVTWLATSQGEELVEAARSIAKGEEQLQRIVGES